MKILIGCEESQTVCLEFRKLGFEAYSCDLIRSKTYPGIAKAMATQWSEYVLNKSRKIAS